MKLRYLLIPLVLPGVLVSISTVAADTISVNVVTGSQAVPDQADPTGVFYAGPGRVKYFVKPDTLKNVHSVSTQFPSDPGAELAFKQVNVENGMVVLVVQAKADAKKSTVQVVITTN